MNDIRQRLIHNYMWPQSGTFSAAYAFTRLTATIAESERLGAVNRQLRSAIFFEVWYG